MTILAVFAQLLLLAIAGSCHATAWLFPGTWLGAWLGQSLLIGFGATHRPRTAFLGGLAAGAIVISSGFYWGVAALHQTFDATPVMAWSIFAVLVAIEAAGFGSFCWIVSVATRRSLLGVGLAPFAWVFVEYWSPRVFPWKMGYSQLELLPLVQIAELLGSTAIGFVMTAVAAVPVLLWLAVRRSSTSVERRWAMILSVGAIGCLGMTWGFGVIRVEQWNRWTSLQPKCKVALIQVDPINVGSEKKLRERSLDVHRDVDLICWPESSLGIYCDSLGHFRDKANTCDLSRDSQFCLAPAEGFSCHLLAGGKAYREGADESGPYAMTAYLISPQQDILGRYRKRTLLPFGEYIPGEGWYPKVREWATLGHLVEAGHDAAPLIMTNGRKLGNVICYEDTLPPNARQTVAAGAEALFSLIQGTAFENPLTLRQHQRLAVLRAVENRRYFVRCASTGITCIVAPTGEIKAELAPQIEGTLISEIALTEGRTLYNRIGEIFPAACTLLTLIGVWLSRAVALSATNSAGIGGSST